MDDLVNSLLFFSLIGSELVADMYYHEGSFYNILFKKNGYYADKE
ncbi:hypothetical protein [Marinilactibacillus psychrotolerans]|nr:hypothetical protein [Marinilactibacillus psychrotolerans]